MPYRQTVEFLRRRYALAILRNDADTASRLRAQLDGIMNPAACARRPHAAAPAEPQAHPVEPLARLVEPLAEPAPALPVQPLEMPGRPAAGGQSPPSEAGQAGCRPRLRLVAPITGLLEWPIPVSGSGEP